MEATLKDGENVFFRRPPPLPAWTDLNGEVRSGKTKRIREGGRWRERERERDGSSLTSHMVVTLSTTGSQFQLSFKGSVFVAL